MAKKMGHLLLWPTLVVASLAVCAVVTGTLGSSSASGGTPLTPLLESCNAEAGSYYNLFTPTEFFGGEFHYFQAHVHDYRAGTTLATNNKNEIGWRVDASNTHAGIQFYFDHDYLGRDVLNWQATSYTGAVTNGSYGVVPTGDFYLRVYEYPNAVYEGTITYGGNEYFVTSAQVEDVNHIGNADYAILTLTGATYVFTSAPCNSMDMRFDGGAPGAGSYSYYPGEPSPCGTLFPIFAPQPLPLPPISCSKGTQIRFFYG